jgi:hypothetical protein
VDSSSSARLGFREFVMRDVDGRVQKVRVDVSYVPELLTYLDTTPGGVPAAARPLSGDPTRVGPGPAPRRPSGALVGGETIGMHDDEDPEVD